MKFNINASAQTRDLKYPLLHVFPFCRRFPSSIQGRLKWYDTLLIRPCIHLYLVWTICQIKRYAQAVVFKFELFAGEYYANISWHLMFMSRYVKADFQSVLRSLSGLMFVRLTNIRGKSMLFVTNCLPYLRGAFKFFFQQFP